MPAKNSISRFHGKYSFINKDLWKKYKKSTGSSITYKEFQTIISTSLGEINKWIMREPIGFQLPFIGHMAINRFKTFGKFKQYRNGVAMPNSNFHTAGNTHRIQYFKITRSFKTRLPFWFFKACRHSNRALAKVLKNDSRPLFNSFAQDHFIKKTPR